LRRISAIPDDFEDLAAVNWPSIAEIGQFDVHGNAATIQNRQRSNWELIMKQAIFLVLMATLLPAVAMAQDSGKYQCTYGDMQRRVEIAHEPGIEVPCSVLYFKDTEMPGEQQELWSADNDPAYCQDKAMELVAKLEGWGWDCGSDAAIKEEPVDEMEPVESEEMLGDPDAEETGAAE